VNWKGRGRKGLQISQRQYLRLPGPIEKIQKKKSHYDLFSSEDLNLKVPEHEEGMQMIRPRRSLKKI
jgi:hypothetical protein